MTLNPKEEARENDKVPYCCKCNVCNHYESDLKPTQYPYHTLCLKHHYEALKKRDQEIATLKQEVADLKSDLHREEQLRPGAWDEHHMRKEIKDLKRELEALKIESGRATQQFIDHHHNPIVKQKNEEIKFLEAKLVVAMEALTWADEFFNSRDQMNAKVHCAPLRLSPITERIKQALTKLGEK